MPHPSDVFGPAYTSQPDPTRGSGELFHLICETAKLFSYLPFKHVEFCQLVLHRAGGGGAGLVV